MQKSVINDHPAVNNRNGVKAKYNLTPSQIAFYVTRANQHRKVKLES